MRLPLDPDFQPIVLFNRSYEEAVRRARHTVHVTIAIRRAPDQVAVVTREVFGDADHLEDDVLYLERLIKSLLWIKGGYEVLYHGPDSIGSRLKPAYAPGGDRAFDAEFMSGIYQRPFVVRMVDEQDLPEHQEQSIAMGRHLEGCRIGFDAGGSDRKVSAVIDGEAVYSEEVVWHPKTNADPDYHYAGILDSMRRAATHLPRVDAIGVSSAGIFIDDEVAAASLFRQVPADRFDREVRPIFKRAAKELGDVPLKVANDGDVTALAGAMSLEDTNVLGIAMGTSEAAGYVDSDGNITGWLNELAFVPVDLNPQAMADEWSMDHGVGVTYFSQDAVIKLAGHADFGLDPALSPAEKLKVVQQAHENGDATAKEIFRTIGVYLGYAIAYYSEFYDIKHLLILGRVTSGAGGDVILATAQDLLQSEFPTLAETIHLTLPNETIRRVGQSIAAASLPQIR
jgi:predicted NBD/HSP70 family sugar kinase